MDHLDDFPDDPYPHTQRRRENDAYDDAQRRRRENSDRLLAESLAYEESYDGAVVMAGGENGQSNGNFQNTQTLQNMQHDQSNQYTQHNASFHYEPQTNNLNVTVNHQHNYFADNRHVTNNFNSGNTNSYNTHSNNTTSNNTHSNNVTRNTANNTRSNNTTSNNITPNSATATSSSVPAAGPASNSRAAPPSKQALRVREAVLTKRETMSSNNFLYGGAGKKTTWSKDFDCHCRVDKCKSHAKTKSIFCSDHTCRSNGGGKYGVFCRVPKHPWDRRCSECMERGVAE